MDILDNIIQLGTGAAIVVIILLAGEGMRERLIERLEEWWNQRVRAKG